MDRRSFLGAITGGLLAAPRAAETQPATRTCRVGVLWFTFPSVSAPFFEAFRDGLRELGYVEGRTLFSRNGGRRETRIAIPSLRRNSSASRWMWSSRETWGRAGLPGRPPAQYRSC